MPGILYVVATPIGNLEDVTFRALRVLREVSLIAAEDTRRTARLLQHYSISTPTTSLHQHNERARVAGLIARLQQGASVALVTDAGTPAVSDPGTVVVAAAHAAGIRVEPVPGPSAAMAVLSASGFPGPVLIAGFPPARSKARKDWLQALASEQKVLVIFEAPHRIRETLADMAAILGDRPTALGREVTKAHEELVVSPISAHLARVQDPRGEFTLVVSAPLPSRGVQPEPPHASDIAALFGQMTTAGGLGRREAVRELARRYEITSRAAYQLIEQGRQNLADDQS